MKPELKSALQSIGWDALYEKHIPDLAPVNARGERRCRSPIPDTIDRNPSFTVNVVNGLWHCFKTDRGGDYILFRALLESDEFDDKSLAIPDYGRAERRIMEEIGLVKPVKPEEVVGWRDQLAQAPEVHANVSRFKPWHAGVMYSLNIGFNYEQQRFTFPIYDRRGTLVNCRLYQPGGTPKMKWLEVGTGGNYLWPWAGWKERELILVEGEPDALSLRSYGFPAVTGTLGAGTPVPEGEWWRGKRIWVLTDADRKGEEALVEACRRLKELAAEVRIVSLPREWPGKPEKADISDYIMYLQYTLEYDVEQIQREVSRLLQESELVEMPHHAFDKEAIEASFRNALAASHLGQRVKFVARVTAKSATRFVLPVSYNITCPTSGHGYCKRCPMAEMWHGNARFIHDPRAKETLKLIQTSDNSQLETFKELHGIIKQCPDPKATTLQAVDVEAVFLNASIHDGIADTEESVERQRREAYVIVNPTIPLEENRDYSFEGFVYAHPKTQQAIFVIDTYKPHASIYERFIGSEGVLHQLRAFQPQPGQTVLEKLMHVAGDLASSVTMILGRLDLHLAYRTVWHSSLRFKFAGKDMHRGWIEALVLGDTRCGKSEAFRQLSSYYGLGVLIDCKMQSVPGILGTVVQASSGEYYVVAGLLPQQDGGVVCFDEFTVPKHGGQSIIEVLSSTRSEGVVRISKAASADFRARVRSIWLANPGTGKLIAQSSDSGVELINRIIPQPEDIARFDLALTVSQHDVPPEVINQLRQPVPPEYSQDMARALLAWTYSRKPEQILFSDEAQKAVMDLAIRMCRRYDSSIPLVEISDQRNRVAKVAVSIAAQCFSTDAGCETLRVLPEHVQATEQLFSIFYDKPVMGYLSYSDSVRTDDKLLDENMVRQMFDVTMQPNGRRLAEELLRLDEFTERTFGTIVPVEGLFTRSAIQVLYANRAIHLVSRGKKEAYEKTPAFTAWLKQYLAIALR